MLVAHAIQEAPVSKTLVQSQFGQNARNYVTSAVHAKGASLGRLIELVAPQPSWRTLDIATAAGHTAFAFAPHVAHVVASDVTPEMLAEARKLATEKGITNVETAEADAEALPFHDATFDLVTCRIAPHHFPDIPAFVAEVWRVLRPGGVFALVDNVSPDATTTPGFTDSELATAAVDYDAFEKLRDPSHGRCLTMTQWRTALTEQGFSIRAEETMDKAMDFAAWCKNMSVAADLVPQLEQILRSASPALAAFLRPSFTPENVGFTLIEGVFIVTKPAS